MAKLNWGTKQTFISPLTGDISIATDDPLVTPHISVSHEIAHRKLGHHKILGGNISSEVAAWELTILQLMHSGEWNDAAREEAIFSLNSYIGDRQQAEWWIDRVESHAKKQFEYVGQDYS